MEGDKMLYKINKILNVMFGILTLLFFSSIYVFLFMRGWSYVGWWIIPLTILGIICFIGTFGMLVLFGIIVIDGWKSIKFSKISK